MLDPAGLRVDLSELTLGHARSMALFVEEYGARASGALVESENVTHKKLYACAGR
jgi:hypothetical protein